MNNYSFKIKQNAHALPIEGKKIALFKNEKLLNEIKKTFKTIDKIYIVKSSSEAKNIINEYDFKNISMLYTDIKSIFKSFNYNNSYLFINKSKKHLFKSSTVIIDKENIARNRLSPLELNSVSFLDDYNTTKTIKSYGKKVDKIIEILPEGIQLSLKINGLWKIFNNNEINMFFLNKIKSKPIVSEKSAHNPFASKEKINNEVTYDGIDFFYSKDSRYFSILLNWLISDLLYIDICEYINTKGNFVNVHSRFKINEIKNFDNFVNSLFENKKINGVEYKKIQKISVNQYKILTKNGYVYLKREEEQVEVVIFAVSSDSEFDLKKYTNGLVTNIGNQIRQIHNINKITKKNIIKITFGLIMFIILFYATFSLLFSIDDLGQVLSYLFSKDSLNDPWIYLILASFAFSFFQPLIVAVFIQKIVIRQKLDKKSLMAYYVSGLLRTVASFLTGNHLISLFVWGWYLNRKLEIRATALVGAIGVASVVRSLIYLMVGSFFMIVGTTSFFIKYYTPGTLNVVILFIISWLGFAWESLHKVWIFLLVLSPAIQVYVANLLLSFKSWTKKLTTKDYNDTYQNVLLLRKTSPKLSWKREKIRIVRAVFLICLPIFVESIETVLYFDIVDSFALRASGNYDLFSPYYNFIDTSGLRLVAANVNNFPLLRALPGRGMFISEYSLNSLYSEVYLHAHNGLNVWGGYSSSDMAQMTTFLTRFFNVYLMMLIKFAVVMIIVLKMVFTRRKH